MKKWIIDNKKLLISFGILTITTFILLLIEVNLIINNVYELQQYAVTKEISTTLKAISLIGLLDIALLTAWIVILMYIFLRLIFPNKKTVQNAFFLTELDFLKKLPNELKKGLDKR